MPTTRQDHLLYLLKSKGPQTAKEISEKVKTTKMAVLQHLTQLEKKGWVEHSDKAKGVGRPIRYWNLSKKSMERFPDNHAEIAVDLIASIREAVGEVGLEKIIQKRIDKVEHAYLNQMPEKKQSLQKRIAKLAELRSEEGYMAEWFKEGKAYWLIENHCPICVAAKTCQEFCSSELELFQKLLGPDVVIERHDHIPKGDRMCSYKIFKKV